MSRLGTWAGSLLSWTLMIAACAAVEQWPGWRGPGRDAHAVSFTLPSPWPAKLTERWQVDVGIGHSSPVVAGGKLYIFTRQGDDETLRCLNLADGKQLWQQSYPAPYQVHPAAAAHGKGPKSTPLVADSRLFTLGIGGVVNCWNAKTGKRLWTREFSKEFEKTSPLYGAAMSPVVDGDKCIVAVGGPDKGALEALNVKTGETIWSCNGDGPAYASPVIATIEEVRQVVTQSQRATIGVAANDGKLLWKIPFQTEYDQNSVTPLVHEGSVVLSGINKGIGRYRVEKQDDEWATDEIWQNKEVSLYMSSPVAHAERLFGFSHRQKGQLFALDLTTGTTLWTSEGRLGDNASLVRTGNVLWALTTQGELIVFRDSDKQFDMLARYKLSDTATWAYPVVLSSGIVIKDESKLRYFELPKAPVERAAGN
jgi:outer membrane protein assembly factor BamB